MTRTRWKTEARERWPKAVWIDGDGRFAVVAHCRAVTVTLWGTLPEAKAAKVLVDRTGCGGVCRRAHEVVTLDGVAEQGTIGPTDRQWDRPVEPVDARG